jgi:hypothetical protein
MKTLTIFLLLLSAICQAQVFHIGNSTLVTSSGDTPYHYPGDTLSPPRTDTIPAIFLVCDTASYKCQVFNNKNLAYCVTEEICHDYETFWQHGYIVITGLELIPLDVDRKPFSKNIVIWDYKIIY